MAKTTKPATNNKVALEDKIEISVLEANSIVEFILGQPMKTARPFTPILNFFERKLIEYSNLKQKTDVAKTEATSKPEQNGDSNT